MTKIEKKVLDAARQVYGINDTEDLRQHLIDEWGSHALHGYGIFSGLDCTDAEFVAKIDDLGVYSSDLDAARQAQKDGLKLIPYRKQPKAGEIRHYRFIDTTENRRLLFGE